MIISLTQQGFAHILMEEISQGETTSSMATGDEVTVEGLENKDNQTVSPQEDDISNTTPSDTTNADVEQMPSGEDEVLPENTETEGSPANEGETSGTENGDTGEIVEGGADAGNMMEGGYAGDMAGDYAGDMGGGDMGTGESTSSGGGVMASWPFVIGISGLTLVISIVLGILLAKKRSKKGFDSYED